jgi:hypothetical protein
MPKYEFCNNPLLAPVCLFAFVVQHVKMQIAKTALPRKRKENCEYYNDCHPGGTFSKSVRMAKANYWMTINSYNAAQGII